MYCSREMAVGSLSPFLHPMETHFCMHGRCHFLQEGKKSPEQRAELKPGLKAYGFCATSQPETWRKMCKLEPSQLISSDSSTNASSTGQKLEVCFVLLSLNKWSLAFQEHSDLSSQYGKTCCLHLMDVKNCSDLKAQKVKSPVKMKIWKQQNIADLLCLVEKNSLGARRCCSSTEG